ncbi:MAG: glycosyltransferase family 2 protein [Acidobacteriaceae bacterium]|jgi:dolichol-phosphate mannosyltransferase
MISVVVPIYNEEELVTTFHAAVVEALSDIEESWEVVYVNDGSIDSSLHILREMQQHDPHVVVVDLSRNWGHMGAIHAGLRTAAGDAAIVMDGDFQDPPGILPQLIAAWRDGAQIVVAVRRSRQERRWLLAKLFPLFYRVLSAISDYPIPLDAGIFSLIDRQALDAINGLRERNRYLPGLRAWIGGKTAIVWYDRRDRLAGDGKLSFISRIKYAMDAVASFSYKPLRLCFALACFSVFLVFALGVASLLVGGGIAAAALGISAAVFSVGSMLLFCLGIVGEYLARVYDEVRDRPMSIVNQVYRCGEAVAEETDSRRALAMRNHAA